MNPPISNLLSSEIDVDSSNRSTIDELRYLAYFEQNSLNADWSRENNKSAPIERPVRPFAWATSSK